MRTPRQALDILRDRGRRGLEVNRVHRTVRSPLMLLAAYGSVYSNHGALTPGASSATAEGMSEDKVLAIAEALAADAYRPEPVRRTYIPKPNGRGQRPLGLPSFSDKLVGQAIAWVLEAIWEPKFSDASTGFRPGRSVHDALGQIGTWSGTVWFIEGDIEDCFGSIDHDILMSILADTIRDQRFLNLVRRFLEAGYLEAGRWRSTRSGAPQGAVLSPILANIYMHEFDRFVANELAPEHTKGNGRRSNREYARIAGRVRRARASGDERRTRAFERQRRALPYGDPMDPGFRRLRYVRYCDDFLLGFIGSRAEAEQIRDRLREWLGERLRLRLSVAKTKITHAKRQKARFLGHEIYVRDPKSGNNPAERGVVSFQVPAEVVRSKRRAYFHGGRALVRTELLGLADHEIVQRMNAEVRGLVNFYRNAAGVGTLYKVQGVAEWSLLKTLAAKHRSSTSKMRRRYRQRVTVTDNDGATVLAVIAVPYRTLSGQERVAYFGDQRIRWQPARQYRDGETPRELTEPELIRRLRRRVCEICDRTGKTIVHQTRSLKALDQLPQHLGWVKTMKRLRRITVMACTDCYRHIGQTGGLTASL